MQRSVIEGSYILVVDDNEEMCQTLSRLLKRHDFVTQEATDGDNALSCILERAPAAMILDCRMERVDGIGLLARMRELGVRVPVIMLTAYPAIAEAVKAIQLGAADYLPKPFDHNELLRSLARLVSNPSTLAPSHSTQAPSPSTLASNPLTLASNPLTKEASARPHEVLAPLSGLLRDMGASRHMQDLVAVVGRVAKTDFSVLVVGETGVGKELVARAIHQASARAAGPFIPLDCGAISESLFENELFGHEKGSFTGATDKQAGKFEAANRGTMFLDEVSNLPASAQPKLLRALEQRAVCRLGATRPLEVDVRIVAATNVHPETLIAPGRFRLDLFYRLNEFVLKSPRCVSAGKTFPTSASAF